MSRMTHVLTNVNDFYNIIPEEFKNYSCFVLTGPDKKPCDVNGRLLKGWQFPENQFDCQTACRLAVKHAKEIAFVFSERHPFIGVDLDECYDTETGQWSETGLHIWGLLQGAGFEFSRSGRGCHFFASYRPDLLPDLRSRKKAGHIELFVNTQYIVLTGNGKQGDVSKDISAALPEILETYFPTSGGNQDDQDDVSSCMLPDLPDHDYRQRLTAFGNHKLACQVGELATLGDGRRMGLNAAVFSLAPYVEYSDMNKETVKREFWDACLTNGVAYKQGSPMTNKEFEKMFDTAYNDSLVKNPGIPVLKERRLTPAEIFANHPVEKQIEDYERATGVKLKRTTEPAPELPQIHVERDNPWMTIGESDIASRFVAEYRNKLRYVDVWNKWMLYNAGKWQPETTGYAFAAVSGILEPIINGYSTTLTKSDLKHVKSRGYRYGALKIASTDREIAATSDQWDKNDWLLNTPNETVDLRTGNIRSHNPDDYITSQTAVGISKTQCPKWLQFINQITQGDIELMAYLQRLAGYCLTGSTREQSLFFLYGSGRNGKGVFVDTLAYVFSAYHKAASSETFTAKKHETHPADLAYLRGARLVTASEIEPDKTWAESRIKQLTGEDTIAARFMRGDFFDFKPQCKILISANNKPSISNVDPAIRSRIKIIPFNADFSDARYQNKHLREELKSEADAILWWGIQGAIAWQTQGLNTPKCILDATNEYFDAEDIEGQWIKSNIVRDFKAETTLKDLYNNWHTFASDNQARSKSQRELSARLERAGFDKGLQPGTKRTVFKGIRIRTPFDQVDDDNNVIHGPWV